MQAKQIPDGEIDTRSIVDVQPDDLRGFRHRHWFAAIGGWPYALRLAAWPDDREVWTGSCPCQPFSAAGHGVGGDDPRHLWPAWVRLIGECRPHVVFGEQVESAITHGWLDLVCDDLEREGYAVGACGLPAASVGAPHIRQRIWIVGDAGGARLEKRIGERGVRPETVESPQRKTAERADYVSRLADNNGAGQRVVGCEELPVDSYPSCRNNVDGCGEAGWDRIEWIPCRDGKYRPTQPGLQPLAHGISGRVGRLRGYGNAIVPHVAAAFIDAYLTREV